jgi:hypothetical protein
VSEPERIMPTTSTATSPAFAYPPVVRVPTLHYCDLLRIRNVAENCNTLSSSAISSENKPARGSAEAQKRGVRLDRSKDLTAEQQTLA